MPDMPSAPGPVSCGGGGGKQGKGKGKAKGKAKNQGGSNTKGDGKGENKGKGKGKNKGEGDEEQPKVKTATQAMKTAADQILECRSWESTLASSDTPPALRSAILVDVTKFVDALENARKDVEDKHGIVFSQEDLAGFWAHWRQHMPPHPATDLHVPVGLAGDDTQYNLAGAKLIVNLLSFPLYNPASSKLCRWPYFVLRYELSIGERTLDPIWRVAAWSLNIAFTGVHPARGPCGEAWPKGSARAKLADKKMPCSYTLTELRGDWKYHRETFGLKRHYNANAICLFCSASKRRGSQALGTLQTSRGFHPFMVKLCSMHMSNLGALQWVNAGVLLGLLERGFFGDPVRLPLGQRLQIVTIRFRRWCSIHGVLQSQPFLTVGMLHLSSPQGPELTLKAYHGRVFVQFMAACCQALLQQCGNNDDELVLLQAVSHGFASWHLRLEAFPRVLTYGQARELRTSMDENLRVYKLLATRHSAAGSLRFPLRPKLHGLQEICYFMEQHLISCRFWHTFRDEDAMGFTKRVCRRVHKGLLEVRTLCRLLMRYRSEEH
ncbi:unnamed protein product [Symbiodinium sp. CCMP2456]|nr:unnamed protein product [Symbiodinium sp. CCMP2456]